MRIFRVLPESVHRSTRAIYDALDARWRLWRLGSHVAALRAAKDHAVEDAKRLGAIRYAWGNEGWSADLEFLRAVARRVVRATGPVLECGSGLTTIVMGVLAEGRGVQVLSLEQDSWWARFVQSRLSRLGISAVTLVHVPLRAYEGFLWYDVAELKLPDSFELAICDGPAIHGQDEPYQTAWRVGLLPVLQERGVRIGEILFDDADDDRVSLLQACWERQHRFRAQITRTPTGSYLIARPRE